MHIARSLILVATAAVGARASSSALARDEAPISSSNFTLSSDAFASADEPDNFALAGMSFAVKVGIVEVTTDCSSFKFALNFTMDRGHATVLPHHGTPVMCDPGSCSNEVYTFVCNATAATTYHLGLNVGGKPSGVWADLTVKAAEVDAKLSYAYGSGLLGGHAEEEQSFFIQPVDKWGNNASCDDAVGLNPDIWRIEVVGVWTLYKGAIGACTEEGVLPVTYTVEEEGKYYVILTRQGIELMGSPYRAKVRKEAAVLSDEAAMVFTAVLLLLFTGANMYTCVLALGGGKGLTREQQDEQSMISPADESDVD